MTGFDWNTGVIEGIENETSKDCYVVRVARRIASKGLMLVEATKTRRSEGFNWGRSSHGQTRKEIWNIVFEDEANNEYNVVVVGQTIEYTKANPYDKTPKNNGETQWTAQASDDTKKVLDWKVGA